MKTKTILIYSGLIAAGLLLGYFFFGGSPAPQTLDEHVEEVHTDEEGNIVYTCSMHPQIRQSEPGNCPICGMELIPADDTQEAAADNPYTLTMTRAAVKLAEIQTSPVIKKKPIGTLTLPGKVVENQNNVSSITAHFPGRIRNLYVDYSGTYVFKGQKLASIYSPELIAAQQELLETMKYKEQNPRLYEAARRKLLLWEFPENTLDEIETSGEVKTELDFFSPVSGYVSEVFVSREGHIREGAMMYQIVNLSTVWVDFQAFESSVSAIQEGDTLRFTIEALPARTFRSTVTYIDPFLDNNSRTVTVRTKVNNSGAILKPGMLARATVQSSVSEEPEMMIPRSAVMWTGKRSIVYVEVPGTDTPTYEAREIILGRRAGEYYVVESGLRVGENLVTNGTFKIDSAAQLKDKLSMMNREPGTGANRTGHDGHTMTGEMKNEVVPQNKLESRTTVSVPDAFHDQLREVVSNYLQVKDAMYSANSSEVSSRAQELSEHLSDVNMSLLSGHTHMAWMDLKKEIEEAADTIEKAPAIEDQRTAFIQLSSGMIEAVKTFRLPGVHYQQYCPMANNGEGAYWLSDREDINNPFFGDQMHNCGETIEKIEF